MVGARRSLLLGLLGLGVSCQRVEEPTSPKPASRAQAAEHPARLPANQSTPTEGTTTSLPARHEPCTAPRSEPPPPPALAPRSCPTDAGAGSKRAALAEASVVFVQAEGTPRVTVEVAATIEQKSRGLMYRRHLAADRGMLFPYAEEDHTHSFWMRNTCVPLDMLFIDSAQRIVGILEQVPTLNDEPRSVPCPSKYVLEVNAGFTRLHGIVPGQRIQIVGPADGDGT